VRLKKQALFSHSYHRLKPETYRQLPDGYEWPVPPRPSDLPYVKRKKKKKPIPQHVLDEWRGVARTRSAGGSYLSLWDHGEDVPADLLGGLDDDIDPMNQEPLEKEPSDHDSAAGEVDVGDFLNMHQDNEEQEYLLTRRVL